MSVFDGTFHLQSEQFDRLMAEAGAYRAQSDLWRQELAAWRELLSGMPDELKAALAGSIADAVRELKRAGDFLDRIELLPPKSAV